MQRDAIYGLGLHLCHMLPHEVVGVLHEDEGSEVAECGLIWVPELREQEVVAHERDLESQLLCIGGDRRLNLVLLDLDLSTLAQLQRSYLSLLIVWPAPKMPKCHWP